MIRILEAAFVTTAVSVTQRLPDCPNPYPVLMAFPLCIPLKVVVTGIYLRASLSLFLTYSLKEVAWEPCFRLHSLQTLE